MLEEDDISTYSATSSPIDSAMDVVPESERRDKGGHDGITAKALHMALFTPHELRIPP